MTSALPQTKAGPSAAPADVPSAVESSNPTGRTLTASLPSNGRERPDAQRESAVAGGLLAADHAKLDAQAGCVGGDLLTPGHCLSVAQPGLAGGHLLTTPDHRTAAAPCGSVGCGDPSPTADHLTYETQRCPVGGGTPLLPPDPASGVAPPDEQSPDGWKELRIWAEMFEDAQKARIACTNRAERSGLDPTVYTPQLEAMKAAEHAVQLAMVRHYKRVVPPAIRKWQEESAGIGDHSLARLLGIIGHPIHAEPHHWEGEGANRVLIADPPFDRNIAKLWAYCGHGDPTRKKAKGMTAEQAFSLGNPRAKMVVHLIAVACMKQKGNPEKGKDPSPYRIVYDHARNTYAEREGWTPGHQHAAALRKVGKEVLRDLWIVARDT